MLCLNVTTQSQSREEWWIIRRMRKTTSKCCQVGMWGSYAHRAPHGKTSEWQPVLPEPPVWGLLWARKGTFSNSSTSREAVFYFRQMYLLD